MSCNPWRSSSSINRSKVSVASRSEIRSNWSCRVSSLAVNSSTSVLRRARLPPARRFSAYQCARFKTRRLGSSPRSPRCFRDGECTARSVISDTRQTSFRTRLAIFLSGSAIGTAPCSTHARWIGFLSGSMSPMQIGTTEKVRFLVVIRKDDASAHGPVPRRKKLSAFICVHLRLIILVGLLVGFLCRSGCRGILL